MISLTPEQREYKQQTLNQLLDNQATLEASLENETRPRVVKSIQKQLTAIEAHISRLQDELVENVIFDEPVAEELFKKAAAALAKEKFYLARRHITRLETIEPFYPGLDRMKQEAESERVSRRTRSIAEGKADNYPGMTALHAVPAVGPAGTMAQGVEALPSPPLYGDEPDEERLPWYRYFFQFHVLLSCLVVLLLACVVFGMAGATILQWLIEGGV